MENQPLPQLSIGTRIIAAGLVDEGMAYEALEKKVVELEARIASSKPICPVCKQVLRPFNFEGYYDKFSGYECSCDYFEGVKNSSGAYCS